MLRHLVEAAHLAERVLAFDPAEAAIAEAIECIPRAPDPTLAEMAVELRLERAKLLAFAGPPADSETLIQEALGAVVLQRSSEGRMEELLLTLTQVVYTLGPRPTLRQVLTRGRRPVPATEMGRGGGGHSNSARLSRALGALASPRRDRGE